MNKKIYGVLMSILALPVVLIARLIKPWVIVRFGSLLNSRIGHFTLNTEIYLCERDLGMHNPKNFDIFYYKGPISNYQLKKMWERVLPIWGFLRWVDRANRLFPGAESHTFSMASVQENHNILSGTKQHIYLTPEEEKKGNEELKKMGIPESSPVVCFHARDNVYLDEKYPELDWAYHSYRNSSIKNYMQAAEELARRGYFLIRMGAAVKESLDIANPKIIDYAKNGRTDFLDIYLIGKCRFFICDTAGIAGVAMIFRRPIAWVNYIPLIYAPYCCQGDLILFKKLWLIKEKRFMKFREIIKSEVSRLLHTQEYEKRGIEVIENTPDEIAALAVEMDERLKDVWRTTEEDEELQRRFWSLYKPDAAIHARISAEFLRQNKELI